MFSQTTFLLVFGLGALCIMLGFFLVLRGIGTADSESSIKLIGLEIRANRVGPGVLFALFGLVLVVTAIGKQPSGEAKPAAAPATEVAANPPPAATAGTGPPPAAAAASPAAGPDGTQQVASVEPPPPPPDPAVARRAREMQLIGQFLGEVANGACNPAILGPAPLLDCQQHVYLIQPRVASMGPVQNIAFLTSAPSPLGTADRFVIQHAAGAVTWTGVLGADGRFIVLVSP